MILVATDYLSREVCTLRSSFSHTSGPVKEQWVFPKWGENRLPGLFTFVISSVLVWVFCELWIFTDLKAHYVLWTEVYRVFNIRFCFKEFYSKENECKKLISQKKKDWLEIQVHYISAWVKYCAFYIEVENSDSYVHDCSCGQYPLLCLTEDIV